jgi:hypothetical protein
MKTTLALSLFLAGSLVASAADAIRHFDDLHADPERGIVRLPRRTLEDGKVTMTYLNVSQIIKVMLKTEAKGPDARTTLIIVSSELEPGENTNQPIDTRYVTYEVRFPTLQLAEAAIEKMFAKSAAQAVGGQPAAPAKPKPEGDNNAPAE